MDLNDALAAFLDTDGSYGGGLSNHGPMAAEALDHLGRSQEIGPFVEHYLARLDEPSSPTVAAPNEWREWLRPRLDGLVAKAESQAGHGLLRVAHAVRGLERAEAAGLPLKNYLGELGAAVAYWDEGRALFDSPGDLIGPRGITAWLADLDRLDPADRSDGLLTITLADASRLPGFGDHVASLTPSSDLTETLDALGAAAAARFRRNAGSSAFAILHGTTVSAMATVLLDHLDDAGKRRLVGAVAGFVAAAIAGFDDAHDAPALDDTPEPARLADLAAATKEDHTIKFTDACLAIAARSGDRSPLIAAFQQITRPYGAA